MKKINYGSFVCEVSVDPDYMLLKHGLCDYERDTIAYAVERFFTRCRKAGKACTEESIQIRVAKGKAKRKHAFMYPCTGNFDGTAGRLGARLGRSECCRRRNQ